MMQFWAGFAFGIGVALAGSIIGVWAGARHYGKALDNLRELYDQQRDIKNTKPDREDTN